MIPLALVHRIAKEKGVPETSIIRDYAQNHLLSALFQDQPIMAFKGGTCLKKIYFPDYRFSDDLDLTIMSNIPNADISNLVADSLRSARKSSGIMFENEFESEQTDTGINHHTHFMYGPLNLRMNIKLDMTLKGKEDILLPVQRMPINHPYPEKLEAMVLAYSTEEMLAEKVRSLFQRTRPRDLYDVWFLQENGILMSDIIDEKFSYKGLELFVPHLFDRKVKFEMAWNNSLRHQMKAVPDFGPVFDKVLQGLYDYLQREG